LNNKLKIYALLVLVLGIWGTVAFKIVNGLEPNLPVAEPIVMDVGFKPIALDEIDTFAIQIPDRDPFLGTLTARAKKTSREPVTSSKKDSYFPNVRFKGMVQNQQSADKVFVFQIKNKQFLLKQGQVMDSVKLVSGNSKTVTVQYKAQRKTLTLE